MADIKSESYALAALFQCCAQIDRISQTGYYDDTAVAAVLRALLITNPQTVEDIYPTSSIKAGFRQLVNCMDKSDAQKVMEGRSISTMAFKLVSLAVSVERNAKIFDKLSNEIDSLERCIVSADDDFEIGYKDTVLKSENMHKFASLYQSIISPNFPPLIIYGQESVLRDTDNQDKIRSLLLAGIRAVILWRQVGGRRRFLVFRRNKIVEYAKKFA